MLVTVLISAFGAERFNLAFLCSLFLRILSSNLFKIQVTHSSPESETTWSYRKHGLLLANSNTYKMFVTENCLSLNCEGLSTSKILSRRKAPVSVTIFHFVDLLSRTSWNNLYCEILFQIVTREGHFTSGTKRAVVDVRDGLLSLISALHFGNWSSFFAWTRHCGMASNATRYAHCYKGCSFDVYQKCGVTSLWIIWHAVGWWTILCVEDDSVFDIRFMRQDRQYSFLARYL